MALSSILFPFEHPFIAEHRSFLSRSPRLAETETSYKLCAQLPGVAADGVKVTATDDAVVQLKAQDSTGRVVLEKAWALPKDADPSSLQSWCVDGVFELHVEKLEAQPITVTVHGEPAPIEDTQKSKAYHIQRDVPGFSASEIRIQIAEGCLDIKAKSERGYGLYAYSFNLPSDVLESCVTAWCTNGMLHIRMPRRAPPEPLHVRVYGDDASKGEIQDHESAHEILALRVPGFAAQDMKLQATPGRLSIELLHGNEQVWKKVLALPDDVEHLDCLRAMCKDGILTVSCEERGYRSHSKVEVEVLTHRPTLGKRERTSNDGEVEPERDAHPDGFEVIGSSLDAIAPSEEVKPMEQ